MTGEEDLLSPCWLVRASDQRTMRPKAVGNVNEKRANNSHNSLKSPSCRILACAHSISTYRHARPLAPPLLLLLAHPRASDL